MGFDPETEGWRLLVASHFNASAGPFWTRVDEAGLILGLASEERHSNGNVGTVHGGVLMTFADIALGCKAGEALGATNCTTINLAFNFTATAKLGSFLTCRPELVRKTTQLVFVRGMVMAGERVVGSAEGIWKVIDPETFARLRD